MSSQAQNIRVIDEIVAVVGENIVMRSELEAEYAQAQKDMEMYDGDLKCEVLNQLVIQKLYLHKVYFMKFELVKPGEGDTCLFCIFWSSAKILGLCRNLRLLTKSWMPTPKNATKTLLDEFR